MQGFLLAESFKAFSDEVWMKYKWLIFKTWLLKLLLLYISDLHISAPETVGEILRIYHVSCRKIKWIIDISEKGFKCSVVNQAWPSLNGSLEITTIDFFGPQVSWGRI